jgi:branched-chain amino acid transport system ATP-binding protein
MTEAALLTCHDVTRVFDGLVANKDISIEIHQGEIVGLIGPNGAGKSTLFNLIAGSFPVTSGCIMFGGRDITGLPAAARCHAGIARTFQVPRSFDSMSVLENVIVGALVHYPRSRAARVKALEVLDYAGLSGRTAHPAGDLTPPERRRLEIARAIATEPRLLLLDEVLTGLTPSESREGVDLVRRIRESGITVVMVEHVMEVVMPLVDRAIVLNLGEVLAEGSPAEIVRDPAVIGAYFGTRNHAA